MSIPGRSSLESAGAFVILCGAGDIGRGIAEALAADGATLVLAGRSLDKLAPLAESLGGTAHEIDAATLLTSRRCRPTPAAAMDASRAS